ncbi:MAG TPA: hypothetical protein VGR62_21590 [Candidatus Binatia bacterium]|nr:hypothetical protein [Candidatus Binatia bacterium]
MMPHRRLTLLALALLLVPALAGARPKGTIKVKFPAVKVAAGTNVEQCYFLRVPLKDAFDVGSWTITNRPKGTVAVQHFLVYQYTGSRLDEFAAQQKQVIPSRACLDLGPIDRDDRQLIASGAAPSLNGSFPAGLALPLPAGAVGILLDANWVGGSKGGKVSGRVVLKRAARGTVRRRLQPIEARAADEGILVPPFTEGTTRDHVDARWVPGADTCLYEITSQMHRRGLFVAIDRLTPTGDRDNLTGGLPNPYDDDAVPLFGSPDYTDPGTRVFHDGLLVPVGGALGWACWHDNGTVNPVRLGCEEADGTAPGSIEGGPAKPCTVFGAGSSECGATDAAYPGRSFTGACVAANVVAGTTPDDEICGIAGFSYDAVNGSCDVSSLPPLN